MGGQPGYWAVLQNSSTRDEFTLRTKKNLKLADVRYINILLDHWVSQTRLTMLRERESFTDVYWTGQLVFAVGEQLTWKSMLEGTLDFILMFDHYCWLN